MIPRWKLQREWDRLKMQLSAIPEAVWEPFARHRHNQIVSAGLETIVGAVDLRPRMLVLLLFQPNGVAPSVLQTLIAAMDEGYSPLVVSNTPLSPADREAIAARCSYLVFRPNFGYDFGGYRDAIYLLQQQNIPVERLVLMNDSVWYPLWSDSRLLRDLETLDADISGPIMTTRGDITFLESYLISISANAYYSHIFKDFWDGLLLTSNKYKVIRRGERGFSVTCQGGGLKLAAKWSNAAFLSLAEQETDAGLVALLQDAVVHDADLDRIRQAAQKRDAKRAVRLAAIRKLLDRGHFYRTFPVFAVRYFAYPLLKKSSDNVSSGWRSAFRDAVVRADLPVPNPTIWSEISQTPIVSPSTHRTSRD